MRANRLRELLNAGKPSLGTHIFNIWPGVTEVVGIAGTFDYVEFVAEYAPYDLHSLDNLGRTLELYNLSGMVKLDSQLSSYLAVRSIGSGLQNVLFTDIRTATDVERCVRSVRAETPATRGLHGAASRRNTGYVLGGASTEYVEALEDAVVAIMIEKREAVENIDDILAVPGVDMIQFGPGDYSMSVGRIGQRNHEEVIEAERYVIERSVAKGIPPRAETMDPSETQAYLDMGVKHFCINSDMRILYDWFRANGTAMLELLGRK